MKNIVNINNSSNAKSPPISQESKKATYNKDHHLESNLAQKAKSITLNINSNDFPEIITVDNSPPKPKDMTSKFLKERIMVAVRIRPLQASGAMGYQYDANKLEPLLSSRIPGHKSLEKTPEMYLINTVKSQNNTVQILDDPLKPNNGQKRDFAFDSVYPPNSTQELIYSDLVKPMVDTCLSGFNGCVFCYGQTSSGKTYTMTGPNTAMENFNPKNPDIGIIFRAGRYITQQLQEDAANLAKDLGVENLKIWGGFGPHVTVQVSYIEIYNEQLRDLLIEYSKVSGISQIQTRKKAANLAATNELRIVENANLVSGIKEKMVENASFVEIQTLQDLHDLVQYGYQRREVAATNMNEESSRSHAVLTINITTQGLTRDMLYDINENAETVGRDITDVGESFDTLSTRVLPRASKIHFVDLAGSERQAFTGTKGQQLKEACAINTSLFCLGNVINALVTHQSHVPHRNSKLTYLLSDSLGGNSLTLMLACIAPTLAHYDETLSTLRFADRAKMVKSNAQANVDKNVLRIQELERQLSVLTKLVNHCRVHHCNGRPLTDAAVGPTTDVACQCPNYSLQKVKSTSLFGRLFGLQKSVFVPDIAQLPEKFPSDYRAIHPEK